MNAVNWFEIPTYDFDRAVHFYEALFDARFTRDNSMLGSRMAIFPHQPPGVGGSLVWREDAVQAGSVPSEQGVKIYLNAGTNLQVVLDRVNDAGGSIVVPKTAISPEIGYFAIFRDTEGNVVGLHSRG